MVSFFSEPRRVSTADSSDPTETEVLEVVSGPLDRLVNQANIMYELISNQPGASQRNIERLELGATKLLTASQEVVDILHPENSEEAKRSHISSMSL